jgi:cytoskeletal protein CcmA (bactofilin family)/predicted RNA-binding Zn-ribbon protein involved in translation (DUF1610 family)
VSSESEKLSGKISVECPHCGFQQMESAFARSTFCRKCSKHFEMEKAGDTVQAVTHKPSIFKKLQTLVGGEKTRIIRCGACNTPQQVSTDAQSSLCGHCGAYIDLRDFKIATVFSRNIQTQGTIEITRKGDVTSTKLVCGSAIIEGKLHGNLLCTGATRVKFKGRLLGSIETYELVIVKGSEIDFVRPVKADHVEISGKISARIVAEHVVTITKTGSLEGTVHARSITVEKGGIFSGELFIGKTEMSQQELLPAGEADVGPASLAFGHSA